MFKCERKRGRDFKESRLSSGDNENTSAGRVVDNQENLAVIEQPAMPAFPVLDKKGFSTEDIMWAVGIWSVLLTMTPVIFVYMLMVA